MNIALIYNDEDRKQGLDWARDFRRYLKKTNNVFRGITIRDFDIFYIQSLIFIC